ncbi:membrane protein [Scenedesmus sp. NREL 46B-D3]|nr:membrane protein [Scenedesmus sp. NREL 46B-D3]
MSEEQGQAKQRYKNLSEFYPHYKLEHQQTGTRVLHFVGTSLFLAQAAAAAHAKNPKLLLSGIISAYGCAWLGHFFVEKNRPATFKYPLMSLISDFKMYFNILTGREPLVGAAS